MLGTRIGYLYRDASGYKFWGAKDVRGRLTLAQLQLYLFDGEFFVPERVGLERLVPNNMNEDDHELHQVVSIEETEVNRADLDARELIRRFRWATKMGWFG